MSSGPVSHWSALPKLCVTAIVYYKLNLFIAESQALLVVLVPSAAVGIPLGAYVIRHLNAETFRRICMSFDAWVVGFGLSRVLIDLSLMGSPWAYSVMVATILTDIYLLYVFFKAQGTARRSEEERAAQAPEVPPSPNVSQPPKDGSPEAIRSGAFHAAWLGHRRGRSRHSSDAFL